MVVQYSTKRHVTAADCGGANGADQFRALFLDGDWTLVPTWTLIPAAKSSTDGLARTSQSHLINRRTISDVRIRDWPRIVVCGLRGPSLRLRALAFVIGTFVGVLVGAFGGTVTYHR